MLCYTSYTATQKLVCHNLFKNAVKKPGTFKAASALLGHICWVPISSTTVQYRTLLPQPRTGPHGQSPTPSVLSCLSTFTQKYMVIMCLKCKFSFLANVHMFTRLCSMSQRHQVGCVCSDRFCLNRLWFQWLLCNNNFFMGHASHMLTITSYPRGLLLKQVDHTLGTRFTFKRCVQQFK